MPKQNKPKQILPAKPDVDSASPTIDEHAAAGAIAVEAYMKAQGIDKGGVLADLLADMRHWADKNKVDWDEALARANMHYEAELIEQGVA